jgi:hypothetical protein
MRLFPPVIILALILSMHSTALSAVIYSGIQNIPISTGFDGVYVNVEDIRNSTNHGASSITGWDVNFFFGGSGLINESNFLPVRINSSSPTSSILNLAYGSLIGELSPFATGVGSSGDAGNEHMGLGLDQFQPGTDGYIGFRLNGSHYGWMRVGFTLDDPGAVVYDWAYDDSGAAIAAGAVPEPGRSTLMLLALTLAALRRRRSAKA